MMANMWSFLISRDHVVLGAGAWHVCCSFFKVWLSAAEADDDDDGGAGSGTGLGGSAWDER